jgi:putative addiction module CopG family antidote
MRTTQQMSITLPIEMADAIKTKVRSGEYATESEVIREGMRALMARDRAVENWMQGQVGPAYDALKADSLRAVSIEQVRARLAAEHASAKAR